MDNTNPSMRAIFNSLPSDVQLAIYAPETFDVYDSIMERYALDEAQREILGIQAGLLMMGLIQPKNFIPVLADALGIPRDKAAFIAQEINRDVLNGIKESLKLVYGLLPQEAPSASPSTMEVERPVEPQAPEVEGEAPATGSVVEQKLGGMFKVGVPAAPTPAPETPASITPTPQPEAAKAPVDPYRELPI